MRQLIRVALIAGPFAAALLGAAVAQAANLAGRTFVAGPGTDTGACARSAPCRSFAYAIGQTAAGGEIVALDRSGYGTLTITKPISIIGPEGGGAHITVPSGGTGIQIAAGGGDSVFLRGLQITGGANGINVATVGRLDVSDVIVSLATSAGLQNNNTSAKITIARSVFLNNQIGITSKSGSLVVNGVKVSGGLQVVTVGAVAQVIDCTIENATVGIENTGNLMFIKRSLLTGNTTGLVIDSGAVAFIDTTTITGNTTGVTGAGSAESYGNNNIVGNAAGNGPFINVKPD